MTDKDDRLTVLWAMDIEELRKLDYSQIHALSLTLKLTPHDILNYLDDCLFAEGNWYNPPDYIELYNGPDSIDAQFADT